MLVQLALALLYMKNKGKGKLSCSSADAAFEAISLMFISAGMFRSHLIDSKIESVLNKMMTLVRREPPLHSCHNVKNLSRDCRFGLNSLSLNVSNRRFHSMKRDFKV